MTIKLTSSALAALLLVSACSPAANDEAAPPAPAESASAEAPTETAPAEEMVKPETDLTLEQAKARNRSLVDKMFRGLFLEFNQDLVREAVGDTYIQHNLSVADGPDAIADWVPILQGSGFIAKKRRWIADREYVVAHTEGYNSPIPGLPQLITLDVYRIEDGTLTEHWDNVELLRSEPNASGHMQGDGPTEVVDLEKTDENKALVLDYVNTVLIGGDTGKIADYISSERYTERSVRSADGIETLKANLEADNAEEIIGKYEKLHFSVAEGNFVFTASEGTHSGKKVAYFDLFDVRDGKIVEHWDTLEEIAPSYPHGNGKF